MKQSLLLFLVIIFSANTFSQNFNIYPDGKEITFEREDSTLFFISTDSMILAGSDSIFYFRRIVDTTYLTDLTCIYTINDTTSMGLKYIRLSDSTDILFNTHGDTIYFKPYANVGEEWIFYRFGNGDFIKATCITASVGTIFPGVDDSIKRIHLEVFDELNNHIESSFWWAENFDMTEHYGLSRFFDINNFPNDTLAIRLAGATNPDTAITEITAADAFDFLLGYEFHYVEKQKSGTVAEFEHEIKNYKYFILEKTQFTDSVMYKAFRAEVDYSLNSSLTYDTTQYLDTVEIVIRYSDYAFLDTLELGLLQNTKFGYSDFVINDSVYAGVPHKYVYEWFDLDEGTGCLSNAGNVKYPEQLYGEGVGLMHYKDSTDSYNYYSKDLIYFQKGLSEWGTPLDFDSLGFAEIIALQENAISVYPNPATDIIHIVLRTTFKEDMQVHIFDTQGRETILPSENTESGLLLNVLNLTKGVYILKIISDHSVYVQKFTKL